MSKILARLICLSVIPNVLDALTQKVRHEQQGSAELVQSHYNVEGSLDELCSAVNLAFRKWCDKQIENDDYTFSWWSTNTLSIMDDAVIFYCSSRGEYSYYKLAYSVDTANNTVTISGDPEKIDVKLVIKTLGLDNSESAEEEAAESVTVAIQTAKEPVMKDGTKKAKAQDEVTDANLTIVSAPVSHSDGNPKVDTKKGTDANSSGASVPDPNDAAKAATPVQHSGEEGVGEGGEPNKVGGPVAAELADTSAGFKGANPASPAKNVSVTQAHESKVGKAEFLLQGVGVDQAGNSFSTILKQSTEEVNGKKLLHIQGIATRADIISKNGFVYPLTVWEQNLDGMNTMATAGKFIGKLEHPDQEQGLRDTAIRFEKFWIQGADVYFDGVVLDTEDGKELQALYAGGVQIDLSSRGYGTAQKQSWRGQEVMVIQDDFECRAFDAVHHGASTGSAITSAQYQAAQLQEKGEFMDPATQAAETTKTLTPQQQAEKKVADMRNQAVLNQAKADFIATSNLTPLGAQAYKQALDGAGDDLVQMVQISESILPILQSTFAATANAEATSDTWAPKFMVKQSAEDIAPKTVGEMIDRLVSDLPDTTYGTELQGKVPHSHFTSPREACRRVLQNIAHEVKPNFHGPSAALGLLALEQGKTEKAYNILEQSLATGATTAAGHAEGGGAPLSAPLIFPLVRRVFPRYIMNEIASIQPMDRPDGKIFFLDTYRTEDPAGVEKRMDLNTSSNPFSSSYADNPTEGAAAQIIRLRLASISVTANTKKLGAAWSLEEMQDLRAYHGLDAAQELMSGVAREMALEWNLKVLNDMLAQASAASLTFGTTAPVSGFPNQIDWDAYIWNYIQKLDNAIFSKRNGPMTHLVCGVDAALALAKSGRMTFGIGGDNGGDMEEKFPGAVYFGVVNAPNGSRYKVMKTNFWGTGTANGSKILGLRRGGEWSDTPYIWGPYTDYVTPVLTDPADFSQKQGIVSRAANQVVVSDAMGIITVNSSVGVVL